MRDWYKLMAAFIVLMAATVLVLGGLGDLQEDHRVMLSLKDNGRNDQGASGCVRDNQTCPWQLEIISVCGKDDLSCPDAQGQKGEASVSCLPGSSHPDSPGREDLSRARG